MTPAPMTLERSIEVAIEASERAALQSRNWGLTNEARDTEQAAATLRAALPFLKAAEAWAKLWEDADEQGIPYKDFDPDWETEDAVHAAFRAMKGET